MGNRKINIRKSLTTEYCPNTKCMIRLSHRDISLGVCPQCGTSLVMNDPIEKDNYTGLFTNHKFMVVKYPHKEEKDNIKKRVYDGPYK